MQHELGEEGLFRNLDGKRPLGIPLLDNIKMDLKEIGWGGME
jgi:hypothetical protein